MAASYGRRPGSSCRVAVGSSSRSPEQGVLPFGRPRRSSGACSANRIPVASAEPVPPSASQTLSRSWFLSSRSASIHKHSTHATSLAASRPGPATAILLPGATAAPVRTALPGRLIPILPAACNARSSGLGCHAFTRPRGKACGRAGTPRGAPVAARRGRVLTAAHCAAVAPEIRVPRHPTLPADRADAWRPVALYSADGPRSWKRVQSPADCVGYSSHSPWRTVVARTGKPRHPSPVLAGRHITTSPSLPAGRRRPTQPHADRHTPTTGQVFARLSRPRSTRSRRGCRVCCPGPPGLHTISPRTRPRRTSVCRPYDGLHTLHSPRREARVCAWLVHAPMRRRGSPYSPGIPEILEGHNQPASPRARPATSAAFARPVSGPRTSSPPSPADGARPRECLRETPRPTTVFDGHVPPSSCLATSETELRRDELGMIRQSAATDAGLSPRRCLPRDCPRAGTLGPARTDAPAPIAGPKPGTVPRPTAAGDSPRLRQSRFRNSRLRGPDPPVRVLATDEARRCGERHSCDTLPVSMRPSAACLGLLCFADSASPTLPRHGRGRAAGRADLRASRSRRLRGPAG